MNHSFFLNLSFIWFYLIDLRFSLEKGHILLLPPSQSKNLQKEEIEFIFSDSTVTTF